MDALLQALTQQGGLPMMDESQLYAGQQMPTANIPSLQQPTQQPMARPDPNGYLSKIMQAFVANKQQDATQNPLYPYLSESLQPTMTDTARSIRQTAQSYAVPNLYKPITPEGAAQERVSSELAPYTTILDLNKKQAEAEHLLATGRATASGGGTGILVNRLMAENPSLSFAQALGMVNKSGIITDASGNAVTIPGYAQARGQIAGGEQTGKNISDLAYKPLIAGGEAQQKANVELGTAPTIESEKTKATNRAKTETEREAGLSKAQAALAGFEQQSKLVTDQVDKALATISPMSTGYGSLLAGLPNTDARKLNNYLQTIKANVGFDKLQDMRANSPTGGALGQVSDLENKLLQAVNGALDPGQADVLKENLNTIKALYPRVLAEKKNAFNHDYGSLIQQGSEGIKLDENAPPTLPSSGATHKYNPSTGQIEVIQ